MCWHPSKGRPTRCWGDRLRGEASQRIFLECRPSVKTYSAASAQEMIPPHVIQEQRYPRGGGLPGSKNTTGVNWEPELVFPTLIWSSDITQALGLGSSCLSFAVGYLDSKASESLM